MRKPRAAGSRVLAAFGGERGAAIIETVLVLPLLIAVLMATMAFGMATVAKAVVTNAARDSARLAAIECGQGLASWWSDAQAAAASALAHGLRVGAETATPRTYGQWGFTASCTDPGVPGGMTTVVLTYAEVNLFPPLAALLGGGDRAETGAGGRVFRLQAAAQFPEE